ncbi:50S ribosomal protein L5 [Pontibacter sp. G13]|uniref:50S ribosomal protein L5 n=1 Tax=Pontibacter sp. G13 TaxID=3074898 RepID=UPI002889E946|nr:50S ribosomal protein L5 [Pontibacter sp. G13]WNJ16529.1 50S ribosomal protein L5 [Pontibacter sp. G13]
MANESRLYKKYTEEIRPALKEQFNYATVMQLPKLEKIVLNRGVGDAVSDKKLIDAAVQEFTLISGQKPVVTYAKKSISNFKLREEMPIGCKVTLRGERMYEFLDRLINIALPRVRDFRGIPARGFDGRGNFTLGVKEQIIFPEINVDKINNISGMDITFVTSAKTDEEAKALLLAFGMPFQGMHKKQDA